MFKDIDWKDLGERCVATFLETFLAMITAEALTGSDGDLLQISFCWWFSFCLGTTQDSDEELQCQKITIRAISLRKRC